MHIDIVPNRKSRPAYLLRESYREGDKVRKRTLAKSTFVCRILQISGRRPPSFAATPPTKLE